MTSTTTPNVLFLTWHDAGRWFSCFGHPTVRTPAMDRLAAEGALFTRMFAAAPLCSPARAAMMTGQHAPRNGVAFLTNTVNNNRIHRDVWHVARWMKTRHRYHVATFGVLHECAHEHVSEIISPDQRFSTDPWPQDAGQTAANFENWLESRRGAGNQPFFAQAGFFESHIMRYYPRAARGGAPQATAKGVWAPPWLEPGENATSLCAIIQGLIERGDAALGRMLDALDRHGLADNTIVAVAVDHGVGLPRAKTECHDPGLEVACAIRFPGRVRKGLRVESLSTHVDVAPTILDLAGLDPLPDVDGRSFAPVLTGAAPDTGEDRHLFAVMVETIRSVRSKDWKLIRNFRPKQAHRLGHTPPSDLPLPLAAARDIDATQPHVELYDLRNDPLEMRNLAGMPGHAATEQMLGDVLWRHLLATGDFCLAEPIRTGWQQRTRADFEAFCARNGVAPVEIDRP